MSESADLVVALANVPDPRARHGIRHRLVTVLALAPCRVGWGKRSRVVTVARVAVASQFRLCDGDGDDHLTASQIVKT